MRLVTAMMRGTVAVTSMFSCDVDYINGSGDDVMMAVAAAVMRRMNGIDPTRGGNVCLTI